MTDAVVPESDEFATWRRVGNVVRGARERAGLSRAAAARKAGVSTSTLANLEAGGRTVKGDWVLPGTSDRNLVQIAEAVDLEVLELFGTIGRPPPTWWLDADPAIGHLRAKAREIQISALSGLMERLTTAELAELRDQLEQVLDEKRSQ